MNCVEITQTHLGFLGKRFHLVAVTANVGIYLLLHFMWLDPFYLSKEPEVFSHGEEAKLHVGLWADSSELADVF